MKKILLILLLGVLPLMAAEKVHKHEDRDSARVIFNPEFNYQGKTSAETADEYIRRNWQRLGLVEGATNLKQVAVTKSLTGTHYRYQQQYQGLPVEQGFVSVSVAYDGRVMKVFNSAWPEPAATSKRARLANFELDENEALDMAWEHLRVHGQQTAMPQASKVWSIEDGTFQLVWRTVTTVDAPMGSWVVKVDAMTGEVLSTEDSRVTRKPFEQVDYHIYDGPLTDREMDTARVKDAFDARLGKRHGKRVDGTALTFDPDPRTTLNDASLHDQSDSSAFTDAYIQHTLRDLTVTDGNFTLVGPYVQIVDFESGEGNNPPSTTADGNWTATRGDNAFNDANTYYHLDNYQRYLQSIGFTGDKSIQALSIEVDSDAVQGFDNSYYDPNQNQLAFGHGCVDDNEDADVIIHEYGHAIHTGINGFWGGGDTGAIGEGFSDYIAASYSYGTPNGPVFNPAWIYTWDGHAGSFNGTLACWDGRFMDRINAVYDAANDYGPHVHIGNGIISDELWGTPLFQAMVELVALGVPREEADAVAIEGLYGFSHGTEMHDLAASTVQAAQTLFPDGPHAAAFTRWFKQVNILSTNSYISAHVPPDNDWINLISVTNIGVGSTTVTATVYEAESGLDNFTAHAPVTFDLAVGESHDFEPAGSNQRWVEFTSDEPLDGTFSFSRSTAERGEEKVVVPLFKEDEQDWRVTIPHIPADRNFVTGAVFLNPGSNVVDFNVKLWGPTGEDLTEGLLNEDLVPGPLDPHEKWVGFLYPGPNGEPGLFDDSESEVKVSFITVNTGFSDKVLGFELFSYAADAQGNSPLSTATIKALPDNSMGSWPIRASLTSSAYSSFSILNSGFSDEPSRVSVYAKDGRLLAEEDISIEGRTKVLGLNVDDANVGSFFRFPFGSGVDPVIELDNPQDIGHVLVTGAGTLHVFELVGTSADEIDGGAVTALGNAFDFTRPAGKLLVFSRNGGDITIRYTAGGETMSETQTLAAGQTLEYAVPADTSSMKVTGTQISASILTRDAEAGSITAVNGGGL